MEKKWEILDQGKSVKGKGERTSEEILEILLENRGIKTKKERQEFLHPDISLVTPSSVGIDKNHLKKALIRIEKAIKNKEAVIVFGDYDVDGITASAILWETLNSMGANVMPYIPHRIDEGYGISQKSIDHILAEKENVKLIITVDNGIVASAAVDYANSLGIDVIITDHHVPDSSTPIKSESNLPKAHAIVHTTKLCGAGVAWVLSEELRSVVASKAKQSLSNKEKTILERSPRHFVPRDDKENDHLALAALGTIADLVPLTSANRAIVAEGLKILQTTSRPGILAICYESEIDQSTISTWEVGRVIAPRLNAMGRLENAMDSLRLICTTNKKRAEELAILLSSTNKERQDLTKIAIEHALAEIRNSKLETRNLLFVVHESYQQGIVGLVAGRLVEEFYRPAIVISKGEKHSKASARSVSGFNLIEFIRSASDLLVDVGGHPMAAGFTVETEKIEILQSTLEKMAATAVTQDHLTRLLKIDCQLDISMINEKLYQALQMLSPFGMANPEPTFVSLSVTIEDIKYVGKERNHVKFSLSQNSFDSYLNKNRSSHPSSQPSPSRGEGDQSGTFSSGKSSVVMDAIGFGMAEKASEFKVGDQISIVYTIDENVWNGRKSLQLKLKDIKVSS